MGKQKVTLWVRGWAVLAVVIGMMPQYGCSVFKGQGLTMTLDEAVRYTVGDGNAQDGNAGQVLALGTEPVLLEAPGKVSMFVIPSPEASGMYKVRLKATEELSRDLIEKRALVISNQVIQRVVDIQLELARKDYDQALALIDEIQKELDGLDYLEFLKASAFFMKKDYQRSKAALGKALEAYPKDEKGQRLRKVLEDSGNEKARN